MCKQTTTINSHSEWKYHVLAVERVFLKADIIIIVRARKWPTADEWADMERKKRSSQVTTITA